MKPRHRLLRGEYWLVDPQLNLLLAGVEHGLFIDEVEAWLSEE